MGWADVVPDTLEKQFQGSYSGDTLSSSSVFACPLEFVLTVPAVAIDMRI